MDELRNEILKAKITFSLCALFCLSVILFALGGTLVSSTDRVSGETAHLSGIQNERADTESTKSAEEGEDEEEEETEKKEEAEKEIFFDPTPFENLALEASSVIVWDAEGQRTLFERNASTTYPLASLTKIMTSITALELASPDTLVTIEREHLDQYGNSGLYVGEQWKLEDLLDMSLVSSANDAAYAVASHVGARSLGYPNQHAGHDHFVEMMNKTARDIGLHDTHFVNATGLDTDYANGGAYGNARDVVTIMEYALKHHPRSLTATRHSSLTRTSLTGHVHHLQNTNPHASNINGLIASKTGYTDLAGGNLAVIFTTQFNRPVIAVVLGSSFNGRFRDMDAIIESTRASFKEQP